MTINFKIIIFLLILLFLYNFCKKQRVLGGKKTIIIGTEGGVYGKDQIERILKKLYDNIDIVYENSDRAELIIRGVFPNEEPYWNKKNYRIYIKHTKHIYLKNQNML